MRFLFDLCERYFATSGSCLVYLLHKNMQRQAKGDDYEVNMELMEYFIMKEIHHLWLSFKGQ